MKTVLLVPRRDDHGHRDRLWAWCRDRWERYFGLPIYEGHHTDGPFNRSAAINTAARLADEGGRWDLGVIIDSDIFVRVSQLQAAIDTARRTGKVTWAHKRWRGFHEDHTSRVINPKNPIDFGPEIAGEDMDVLVQRTNPLSWSCCMVVPRKVWDAMGGFDERFVGWGYEDMAVKSVIQGRFGWERIEADVYHLWHPRSGERIVKGQPAETASPEYLTNARLGRRYMVAQYRDVGYGDDGVLPDELRAKHVDNLMRDDARLTLYARHYGLPDWTGWWPTLDELLAGAREHKNGPSPTVTVIVHTGGDPETWAARSDYLRLSLASLSENVTGEIVQRVVYSDWGADFADELRAIVESFGFYVAGDGHHGYTGSMQRMWTYLAKRAQGSYIFATEDDFLYPQPVDLGPMVETLRAEPHLAQIALLRDPYPAEASRGGILGHPLERFTRVGMNGTSRLEHREFFTCNPSVFRKSLTATPWPDGRHSETVFGKRLLRDERVRFAFWGSGEESTQHIGSVRAGMGY